ncbi:class F sortase [Streptomyces sp. H39-S7]|nr:class F sortase [Streptomyces sp. H39-S7]MCZ4125584.1 class F sortase [Streptomyces sp. H39-S7]
MYGRRSLLIGSGVLAVAAVGLIAVGLARQEPAPPQADRALPVSAPQPSGQNGGGDHSAHTGHTMTQAPLRGTILKASTPERITIPELNVDSALESLGLDAHRAMQTPRDPDKAGWFTPGPTPGELGPSVIAGHVTWNQAPGVFFKLGAMKKGQTINVTRQDGTTAVFTVERIARYPKDKFPTVEVYGNLDHAGLRLITCGGNYSTADHHYTDNVVVYASLTSTR